MKEELHYIKSKLSSEQQNIAIHAGKAPTGHWFQLYFKAPFTVKEAKVLLGECVDEALKRKLLKGNNQCEIELVVEDPEDFESSWKAIRLTCPGTRSVAFRSCILDYVSSK